MSNFVFWGLGVCYLLAGGRQWHRATMSCLRPAEIQSLVMCLEDTTIACSVAYIYTYPICMVIFTFVA